MPPSRKSKKPRQGEEEESGEAAGVDNTSEEQSSGDESEEEREEEISMPTEGHKISKLKCVEMKGRGRVWSAFTAPQLDPAACRRQ